MKETAVYIPLYLTYKGILEPLTDEQLGKVIRAVLGKYSDGEVPELEPIEQIVLNMISQDVDKAQNHYKEIGEKRKKAVENRWSSSEKTEEVVSEEDTNEYQAIQTDTNGYKPIQKHTKQGKEKEKEKEKENIRETSDDVSCTEPLPVSVPEADVVAELILNDGTKFPLTEQDAEEYGKLYPAVDIRQAFRSMAGWTIGNPTKRKTKRGVKAFVTSWLSREQNQYHPNAPNTQTSGVWKPDNSMIDFLNSVIAEGEGA